jgi:hypothetical protein
MQNTATANLRTMFTRIVTTKLVDDKVEYTVEVLINLSWCTIYLDNGVYYADKNVASIFQTEAEAIQAMHAYLERKYAISRQSNKRYKYFHNGNIFTLVSRSLLNSIFFK